MKHGRDVAAVLRVLCVLILGPLRCGKGYMQALRVTMLLETTACQNRQDARACGAATRREELAELLQWRQTHKKT